MVKGGGGIVIVSHELRLRIVATLLLSGGNFLGGGDGGR